MYLWQEGIGFLERQHFDLGFFIGHDFPSFRFFVGLFYVYLGRQNKAKKGRKKGKKDIIERFNSSRAVKHGF